MKRPPPVRWSLFADQRGVVFLEFLIAFVPMWTFFLCVVQLALITYANLMVKHSADLGRAFGRRGSPRRSQRIRGRTRDERRA